MSANVPHFKLLLAAVQELLCQFSEAEATALTTVYSSGAENAVIAFQSMAGYVLIDRANVIRLQQQQSSTTLEPRTEGRGLIAERAGRAKLVSNGGGQTWRHEPRMQLA